MSIAYIQTTQATLNFDPLTLFLSFIFLFSSLFFFCFLFKIGRVVAPFIRAVSKLIADPQINHTWYYRDVLDTLENVIAGSKGLVSVVDAILTDVDRYHDKKLEENDKEMNQTLNLLTLVTCVLVPAQTLSGIYGMNFVQKDGSVGIPELHIFAALGPYAGYIFFWVLVLITSLTCGICIMGRTLRFH